MIDHVMNAVPNDSSEIFISVDSQEEADAYGQVAQRFGATMVWKPSPTSAMTGKLMTVFERSDADAFLVLPCDTPLVSKALTSFLLKVAPGFNAVVPRWPNGETEVLHASYNRSRFVECAVSLRPSEPLLSDLVGRLGNVLYVLTETLRQVDERLESFFVVESRKDLVRAQRILRRGSRSYSNQGRRRRRGRRKG